MNEVVRGRVSMTESCSGRDLEKLQEVPAHWNATKHGFSADSLVWELFERAAAQSPDAVAVSDERRSLSYSELDEASNGLARYLQQLGVGPDTLVAVCMERSVELMTALLAISKAGGAYVPLEPTYPLDRLLYMLNDSRPRVLITHAAVAHALREELEQGAAPSTRVLDLSSDDAPWTRLPTLRLARGTQTPEQLAYVIYTSGSTGRPKGVMVEHRSVVNRLEWMQAAYGLTAEDVVLQKTPISFDVSVWELFWPLLNGARLVMARPNGHKNPDYLCQVVAEQRVTTLHFVPSMLSLFLDCDAIAACTSLARVFASGEALPAATVRRWQRRLPAVQLTNLYGPTEATVDVTAWSCPDDFGQGEIVPIGRPIWNTELHILDEARRPVPVGTEGELYIGGVGLARGYLNRPELTSERFLLCEIDGLSRPLYRTGDVARYLGDGNVEFVGRNDGQVKLRGFRVELGEIEARLSEHPAVKGAVVEAREVAEGDRRLIGYVTLNDSDAPSSQAAAINGWEELYDQTYGVADGAFADERFNGWKSSYSQRPFSQSEMEDWRDGALSRLLALKPRNVLELGCGTGLILDGLVDRCESYLGTDVSSVALEKLRKRLGDGRATCGAVQLMHADALGALRSVGPRALDTIVLNSVVQYFPSAEYLLQVVTSAVSVLGNGGHIFIGDVRRLDLRGAFYASVALAQAPDDCSVGNLRAALEEKMEGEVELLLDPTWFLDLMRTVPSVSQVEIAPKASRYDNEMSAYRYDVLLSVHGRARDAEQEVSWVDCRSMDEAALERAIRGADADILRLAFISNPLTDRSARLFERLMASPSAEAVSELARDVSRAAGMTCGKLSELGAAAGYDVRLNWVGGGAHGEYHAVLTKNGEEFGSAWPAIAGAPRPAELATQPLRARRRQSLPGELRSHLASVLPEYMVPSAFVVMDRFPLTPNGKLDRSALKAPTTAGGGARNYEAPRGAVEARLARLWEQVLNVPQVGRNDRFMELGGHSLLVIALLERMKQEELSIDLESFFNADTLADVARAVVGRDEAEAAVSLPDAWSSMTAEERAAVERHVAGGTENLQAVYPLSSLQQGFLFHHLIAPQQDPYVLTVLLRLENRTAVDAYLRAARRVVERHDILRTSIVWEGVAEALQVVSRAAALDVVEVSIEPGTDAGLQLRRTCERGRLLFDLSRGPLMRLVVAAEPDSPRWLMAFFIHHIVCDHASLERIFEEIRTLMLSPDVELPPAASLGDIVRANIDAAPARHHEFFERMLGDVTELTAPFGFAAARVKSDEIAGARREVPASLTTRIEAASRRFGATAAALYHLAWALVVGRCSQREDVVFGTTLFGTVSQRPSARGVGLFMNTLPIRLRTARSGVDKALRATQRCLTQLMVHERASLADAASHSRLPGGGAPFAALLNYYHHVSDIPEPPLMGAGQVVDAWRGVEFLGLHERTNYPLVMNVGATARVTTLHAQCLSTVPPERVCDLMLTSLEGLVGALERDANFPLANVDVLPAADRVRLLTEWNSTDHPYSSDALIGELFEHAAKTYPDAVAVCDEGRSLSYQELDEHSNRLARVLRRLGVGRDVLAAVCMERSVELMIGLLAVLKAGGGYVPLDPSYPLERLRYMVSDSRPRVILTHGEVSPEVSKELSIHADGGVPVLDLSRDETWRDEQSTHLGRGAQSSQQSAYVIYTSGSTGRPKGVLIEHRSVVNRLEWMQATYGLTPDDVVLQKTPIGFDVSVWELFWPLLNGARLVMAAPGGHKDPDYLRRAILKHRVTTLHFVPSMLAAFLATAGITDCNDPLVRVVSSGEALPTTLARAFFAKLPDVELHNLYGPTEATVDVTSWQVTPNETGATVPIGRAIWNTQLYVLDEAMRPVPVGAQGELYIGGVALARGYLNKYELTQQRFVENPLSVGRRGRLYRTGDLAKYRDDGAIEFLGRNDHQIKLRGFRIELGEIETKLAEHPAVREAVVVALETDSQDKRLVAYVTSSHEVRSEELREFLSQRLPEYMVPSSYVRLATLPLTPNGKLDRNALPQPTEPDRTHADPPRGDVELRVAALWRDVLGVEEPHRDDHFFESGGHSLLAVKLLSRIRLEFGVDLRLEDVFARPTLAALAAAVSAAPTSEDSVDAAAPWTDEPSFGEQRLWFLAQVGAEGAYNMPFGVRLEGELNLVALRRALDTLVARHEVLRSSFSRVNGRCARRVADNICFALEVQEGTTSPDELVASKSAEAALKFDLERGPLCRGKLLRTGEQQYVLLLTFHHIVSDGWSMGIIARELESLYGEYTIGTAAPLPAVGFSYAQYAARQRRWLESDSCRAQLDYWSKALAGAPALLALPLDRPRPPTQDHGGARVEVKLEAELVRQLKALARARGATLFMTLLTGFSALLSRLSGQDDVVVGVPAANRGRAELEAVVGLFVNTLAVRIDLTGAPTFDEALNRVRAATVTAQRHQELPFERVVKVVCPTRSLAYSPIFQVMFAWQSGEDWEPQLPGLVCSPERIDQAVSKFDLTLDLGERDGCVVGALEYATALFDMETVQRFAGYLEVLLRAMVTSPAQQLRAVGLLSAAEQASLLEAWNPPLTPTTDRTVHEVFQEMAARYPERAAVAIGAAELSYRQLNAAANRLATHLRDLGVGEEDRVGVCFERSFEMVIAILAILKAGAAYLPLDPAYPQERLRYMLVDSGARLVLTHSAVATRASAFGVPMLAVDSPHPEWAGASEDNLDQPLSPSALAYVVYTSGSTGRPKGVMVEHRGWRNLAAAQSACWEILPGDRVFQFASLNFDASAFEIAMALCHGAVLCLPQGKAALAGETLLQELVRSRATHVTLPPVVLGTLPPSATLNDVKTLVIAGEAPAEAVVRRWNDGRLVNAYGPTEATVWATWTNLQACDTARVHIGKPIPNVRVHILDERGALVPPGVVGELCIGGLGVARGYVNRPELTREKFVEDRLGPPGARLYRTGDLARHRNDGNIEFLGRRDFQIKLRGFRVELTEIEARLGEHPQLREAVVLARGGTASERRLVAYYVEQPGSAPALTPELLKSHLATSLPEHMIPAAFVALPELPLTRNGKVDRDALPEPVSSAFSSKDFVAPQTEIELRLAELWCALLGRERVSRLDNFFELGGHSLLAVTLLEQMTAIGFDADVRTLFSTSTLAELAAAVETASPPASLQLPPAPLGGVPWNATRITPDMLPLVTLTQQQIDELVAEVPGGAANVQDIYPLGPLQEGIFFHHLMLEDVDTYLVSFVRAFSDRSTMDAYLGALRRVIARHDILRTAVKWRGLPEPVQVVLREAPLVVEELTLDCADGDVVAQLVELRGRRAHRLDLETAPLLRWFVARDAANDRWVALELIHHMIGDHTTGEITDEEVRAHMQGRADELPPPVPFKATIAAARLGASSAGHESFFKELLADVDEPTAPFGLLNARGDGGGVVERALRLPTELALRVRAAARSSGVTPASLFHVAWACVLARVSGRDDVVFGTVLFGRTQGARGSSRAMGMFINTLPVRLHVTDPGVQSAVKAMHHLLASLLRHEHASLALVQRCSGVPAPLPLLLSLLNYRHSDVVGAQPLGPCEGVQLLASEDRTNFPLALSVDDLGEDFELTAQAVAPADPDRVCEMVRGTLEQLVCRLESADTSSLRDIDVLSAEERHALISACRGPDLASDHDTRCLHELFEERARLAPGATALIDGARQLSFAELEHHANWFASQLPAGLRGGRVVLCMPRSLELVVAMLAVLKSGASYVPIDSETPSARISAVLADCQPALIITNDLGLAKISESGVPFVSAEELLRAYPAAGDLASAPHASMDSNATAYIIYTSGSTGTPKGVEISHAAIVNHMQWMRRQFPLSAADRVLQKTSIGFDASVWEFHAPLAEGAALVIAEQGAERDPRRLVCELLHHEITVLQVVPTLLDLLIGEPDLVRCATLRRIFCGGEVLPIELVRALRATLPDPLLVNLYGPTEATIDATFCVVDDAADVVSIGAPIDNMQVYVLDSTLRPVPLGVTGQLCIAGRGVARGYWNRPELTAERFVANPFGDGWLYLTGDLARIASRGRLEFIGRSDLQIKLRGNRIELGEIESVLRQHSLVQQASVIVREDRPGDKRLVGYVTPAWDSLDAAAHVAEWAQIHETVLDESLGAASEFAGWNSAYTRAPIPEVEMQDWLDGVLARIRSLKPRAVLEIGCGTGMILRRLAPSCSRYVGTDFSSPALKRLGATIEADAAFRSTTLCQAEAQDFSALPLEPYDTIVLNSVVQYFPSLEYLLDVLTKAIERMPGSGALFVGDVRNHRLLTAFHLSVQLRQAPSAATLAEVASAAAQRAELEHELAIDPAWFVRLGERLARVSHVEVMPRESRYTNELSAYRYDVVIHVDEAPPRATDVGFIDCREQGSSDLAHLLRHAREPVVAVGFITNSRVFGSASLVQRWQAGALDTLPNDPSLMEQGAGMTCADLGRLCRDLGYQFIPSWNSGGELGEFHALVIKRGSVVVFDWSVLDTATRPPRQLSNQPLRAKLRSALPELLRAHATRLLPGYMVPVAFVVLDALPRTLSGKLDSRALPSPEERSSRAGAYDEPENEVEARVARLWEEVLGVARVGRSERFFDLGGHSLLAVSLIARLRREFKVEVPLKELFAHPRLSEFAAVVARASNQTRQAVEKRREAGPAVASFAQQRMWFIAQMDGARAAYHMPMAFRIRGELDVSALRDALAFVVDRHDSLRTTFVRDGETLYQRVAASVHSLIPVEHVGPHASEQGASELVRAFASTPFDLERGPLWRAQLLVLGATEHVLLLTAHHIISDARSTGVLLRDLTSAYLALTRRRAVALPALRLQYADYSEWQRDWLGGEVALEQAAYWRRQLAGAPPLLELPWDRARPEEQSFVGSSEELHIDAQLTRGLKELSRRHGTTLFTTVLSAFAAVLARLSGQEEVVIGTPVANRAGAEIEEVVGLFVNTLALRLDFSGRPTIAQLLERARSVTVDAQQHQELPFEKVVESLRPARSLAYTPLFQVMFVWQSLGEQGLTLDGLEVEREPVSYEISKFDLTLSLAERGGELAGTLEYATALFDPSTIRRYLAYFSRTLAAMVENPEQLVARIPWATPSHPSTEPSLSTGIRRRRGACVHELFEAQVASAPQATALVFEGTTVTYAELNVRANRLAHRLRSMGVQPDERVALCAERGVELVIGILAILKAGAGYVPIDPEYPTHRCEFILDDAQPKALVAFLAAADERLASATERGLSILNLRDEASWSAAPASNPRRDGLRDHHLAYVIYTSGSTGQPKGVMVEHRNVTRLLTETDRTFEFTPADTWTLFHSAAFDFSVWELWGALAYGGKLVVVPFTVSRSSDDFHTLVCRERVTVLNQTPSAFRGFMAAAAASPRAHRLRYVIFGGEALEPSMLGTWWADPRNAEVALINMYGITETTVHVTHCRLTPEQARVAASPIGRPIDDLTVYVLDELGEPAPAGGKGEFYVAGPGVARGYLNRPELTNERFLPDPFAHDPDARMYRTGDVGRIARDGSLEFCGRNDGQVKLRGFRIELGEIQAKLTQEPEIRDALVVLREDVPGNARLVAYCTTRDAEQRLEPESLRQRLARWLPEYMVPAAYVQLESLPLTVNGKLDRRALPAPGQGAFCTATSEPPIGVFEVEVARIWCELLGLEAVGRHDNFFELGGHSLLATSVVARVQQRLGTSIRLKDVFALPTLCDFAQAASAATPRALLPFGRTSAEFPPLSFAQQRLWFLARLPGVSAAYHIPLAARLQGELDSGALTCALDHLVSRHTSLRTTFALDGAEPAQLLAPEGVGFPLELIDLSHAESRDRLDECKRDAIHSAFDLSTGPLARGQLIRLTDQDHLLILTLHHIVADGWSIDILVRELSELYTASVEGRAAVLTELTVTYADYSSSQRAWLKSPELAAQAEYWQSQLQHAPGLLELPTDRPRPPEQDHRGQRVEIRLDPPLVRRLRELGRRQRTTLFTAVLTGFIATLSRLSGQEDIVVGVPVANRTRPELENMIGLFANTLAVRVPLRKGDSLLELLKRTDASAVGAQENQELPFERVVDLVKPERSLAYSPIFQVMMSWQSAGRPRLSLPGLSVSEASLSYPVAKFDLVLDLLEDGDEVVGGLDYAVSLFDRETVERFAGYLLRSLHALSEHPSQAVDELEILSTDERDRLLFEWNATAVPFPEDELVHEMIETRARSGPSNVALRFEGEIMTYAELSARANQVARYLNSIGVGPEARVAICLSRGFDMMVAILGVLRSGAAYVPLDPEQPRERLAFLLRDSAPKAVFYEAGRQADGREALASDARWLAVDTRQQPWASCAREPFVADGLAARNAAYVIYTSGSTGQPKGVVVEHRNLANYVHWASRAYDFSRGAVVSSSICFDATITSALLPLVCGTTVDLVRDGDELYGLAQLLTSDTPGLLKVTPAHLHALGRELESKTRACNVGTLVVGGEALPPATVERWRKLAPDTRIVNEYGPTETVVGCAVHDVAGVGIGPSVPIGRPIANTRIYVLDRHRKPVPRGVVGEIYIGGAGVARGYLNRDDLTQARFLPDPFIAVGGARMYRTGDLARYAADGTLEFLGRNDLQIKLRGYRIELGELEHRLRQHPGVESAVVVARTDVPGDPRLVAYCTSNGTEPLSVVEICEHLAAAVPRYMLPSSIVLLAQLPLTVNGKIDRAKLPAPKSDDVASRAYLEPIGTVEKKLARLWEEILGIERVGRQDRFFELGGHSLLAVSLLERMRQEGLRADVRDLFRAQDLAALARMTEEIVEVEL